MIRAAALTQTLGGEMAGLDVWEEVDVASSMRSGHLVLSRELGGEYAAAGLMVLAAVIAAMIGMDSYRSGEIGVAAGLLLLPLPLGALWLAWRLFKATARNRELVRINATDSINPRAAFTSVAEKLGWEKERNNSKFGRYYFGRYVVIVFFRKDHILLNCRRAYMNRMRLPIRLKERDEVVRVVASGVAALTDRTSNSEDNMENEKPVRRYTSMLCLLCLSVIISLTSCSKNSGSAETQPTPLPSNAKMEGQSVNWKVKVHRFEQSPLSKPTLSVELDLEYLGPNGDVPAPDAALVDSTGQQAKFSHYGSWNYGTKSTTEILDPKNPDNILRAWLSSATKPPRTSLKLKTGDQLKPIYNYEMPAETANLSFVFSDVPPIRMATPYK